MCYKEISQAEFFLKIHQKIQNLSLNGNVESGNRFIADNKFRFEHQRTGNSNTLSTSAVKLMRICHIKAGSKTDDFHDMVDPFVHFTTVFANLINDERLGYQLADIHASIQAGIGILKDHLHLRADFLHLPRRHRDKVLPAV